MYNNNQFLHLPRIFFNDQELLNYNFYSDNLEAFKIRYGNELNSFNIKTLELLKNENIGAVDTKVFLNLFDKKIIVHSEQNTIDIELYRNNGFVPVHYWAHALMAIDWYRYAKIDQTLNFEDEFKKDFQIYSRAWSGTRTYRLKFLDKLISKKLNNNCYVNFNPIDIDHYSYVYTANNCLEDYFNNNNISSDSSADYSSKDYKDNAIDVVLETVVDRIHITEKILRPIACGKPFITLAAPGALSYIQTYGFETFHPFINESYDKIIDLDHRMDAILSEMYRIKNLSYSDKQDLFVKLHNIAKVNKQKFFNVDFSKKIINEYNNNIHSALDELYQHKKGTILKSILKEVSQTNTSYYNKILQTVNPDLIKPYLP